MFLTRIMLIIKIYNSGTMHLAQKPSSVVVWAGSVIVHLSREEMIPCTQLIVRYLYCKQYPGPLNSLIKLPLGKEKCLQLVTDKKGCSVATCNDSSNLLVGQSRGKSGISFLEMRRTPAALHFLRCYVLPSVASPHSWHLTDCNVIG